MIATLERRARSTVSGLPATYWYLFAGTLIDRLGAFVVPFLALYLTRQRGLPVEQAALVVAANGAGGVPASLVGGALADRVGRKATIVLGLVLGALGVLLLGWVREPALLLPVAFVVGFTGNLYRPAVSAAIADVVPPEHRVRAFSLLYWAINLGFSVSPVIAGLLADVSFSALFVADAVTTLAYAALVLARVPESRPKTRRARALTDSEERAALAAPEAPGPLGDPAFLAFCATNLLFGLVFAQASFTLPLEMQAHGVTPREFGLAIALNGVLIVLLQIPSSRVLGKLRPARVLAASCLFTGAGFGLVGLVGTLPLYAGTIAVWTVGEILSAAVAPTVVSRLAPAHRRGAYQGAFQMTWGLAALAGPLVGGWLHEALGPGGLWAACALGGLVSAAGFRLLERRLERRLAAGA